MTKDKLSLLCVLLIFVASLGSFSLDFRPGKAEREAKKQAFLADHNLLRLQLAKCERYKSNIDQPGA